MNSSYFASDEASFVLIFVRSRSHFDNDDSYFAWAKSSFVLCSFRSFSNSLDFPLPFDHSHFSFLEFSIPFILFLSFSLSFSHTLPLSPFWAEVPDGTRTLKGHLSVLKCWLWILDRWRKSLKGYLRFLRGFSLNRRAYIQITLYSTLYRTSSPLVPF